MNGETETQPGGSTKETRQAESIDEPPNADEGIPPSKIYHPLSFPVLALLMPASVLGVLARLGLVALMTYDGHSVFPLAYVQALGCLIMGMGLRLKEPLGRSCVLVSQPGRCDSADGVSAMALYILPSLQVNRQHVFSLKFLFNPILKGFCGSLTTFSSWQLDTFNAWINAGQFKRGGFRDVSSSRAPRMYGMTSIIQFLDGVGISTITLSLALASLAFGHRIASVTDPLVPSLRFPRRITRYSWSLLAVLTYAATYITYFVLPAHIRHQATAALLFSFPGTLTRYLLAVLLNQRFKALPMGTLAANTLGTACLAAFHVAQRLNHPVSTNACSVLQGLADGYCGCLTTVSTFAAEISAFEGRKAIRYALLSWALGQVMMVLIFGIPVWAGSASKQQTCTF